jgi:signal transduction histidine kinase
MEPSTSVSVASETSTGALQRLPSFIAQNTELIVGEWEAFARTLTPSSTGMTPLALRDHIHQILEFIVEDMSSAQTPREQTIKSQGKSEKLAVSTAAETHAGLRLAGGFAIDQMVSEYRALRASVVKLWSRARPPIDGEDLVNLTRFNESIDQALAESVSYYTREIIESKDLFVGILSQDLRNPLRTIALSSELMLGLGGLNERQIMLATGNIESALRAGVLINNLVDISRARFGASLPVNRRLMDLGFVGHQIVDEFRLLNPTRTFTLDVSGDLKGRWDKPRIGQIFSNLLSNAIQYGFTDTPISVTITGSIEAVEIAVHNSGKPIQADKIDRIFNPLTRASPHDQAGQPKQANHGLGLFITRQIVEAHGGTIDVISSEENGTTFTARLPRSKRKPNLHLA